MMRLLPFACTALVLALAAPAIADTPPPANAKPLSEIIRTIEAEPGFRFIDEIEWDDGVYEIEFYTRDGERKFRIDPVSGERR